MLTYPLARKYQENYFYKYYTSLILNTIKKPVSFCNAQCKFLQNIILKKRHFGADGLKVYKILKFSRSLFYVKKAKNFEFFG